MDRAGSPPAQQTGSSALDPEGMSSRLRRPHSPNVAAILVVRRTRPFLAGMVDAMQTLAANEHHWSGGRSRMSQGREPKRNRGSRLCRFWSSAAGFWKGKSSGLSWPLSIALVAIALAQLAIQYLLNYWNRDFFNALERRDGALLWNEALIFVPLACSNIALAVASVWGRMTMQRKWRQWLTTHLLSYWLTNDRYRRLRFVSGEYQNAEYRISFDARVATDAPVDLVFGLVTSALTALVFIQVLWSVGGSLTFVLSGSEITVPAYLVIGVVVYSSAFTALMIAVGRNLTSVIQAENQAEAELRAATNHIRELGEGTPPAAAGPEDDHSLWHTLREVLLRWRQLCWQLMGTTVVSQTDVLLAPVVAWVLCAPKFLAGGMMLGELTQAAAAFVMVQAAFNWVVDNYQRLADWRSSAYRVATLLQALDDVDRIEPQPQEAGKGSFRERPK
jgi:putative ATP-binding cassette transporter